MDVSAFDIRERYNKLTNKATVYSYLGSLKEKEMNNVLRSMELILDSNVDKKVVRKKLFNILIEITQNLYNYFDSRNVEGYKDIFIFVKERGDGYVIITGNFLLREEISSIKARIDMVNAMSETQIKELYRGILNFGGVSEGGGAGLGFVDLVRRSGKKLKYKFEDIDEKFSFFTLEVLVTD